MLFDVARSIAAGHAVTERAATDALAARLAGNGIMLRDDAVELRRQLVDCQFVVRDGFGRAYRRAATYPAQFADVCLIVETLDFSSLTSDARSHEAQARATRNAAHLMRATA